MPSNNTSFGPNQEIQIPINKLNNGFMDTSSLALSFNVNFTIKNNDAANATNVNDGVYMIGTGYSFFQRQVLKVMNTGQIVEVLDNIGPMVNELITLSTDYVNKYAMSSYMGTNQDGTFSSLGFFNKYGIVAANGGTKTISQNFVIPICGALTGSNKMFNLNISDLELDLTLVEGSKIFIETSGVCDISYTIDNVELIYDGLVLENQGYQALVSQYPSMQFKTSSWKYGSVNLPAGQTRSNFEFILPHQVASLKRFMWSCSPSDAFEKSFSSVNPNLQSWCLNINGEIYPQQRVRCDKPALCAYEVQKAMASFGKTDHHGLSYNVFAKCSLKTNGSSITGMYYSYDDVIPTQAQLINGAVPQLACNKFFQILDLEKINNLRGFYSGISTKNSTNSVIFEIAETLANVSHQVSYYSEYDLILTFDNVNNMIIVSE